MVAAERLLRVTFKPVIKSGDCQKSSRQLPETQKGIIGRNKAGSFKLPACWRTA